MERPTCKCESLVALLNLGQSHPFLKIPHPDKSMEVRNITVKILVIYFMKYFISCVFF
jgi:hypothetical protein